MGITRTAFAPLSGFIAGIAHLKRTSLSKMELAIGFRQYFSELMGKRQQIILTYTYSMYKTFGKMEKTII